MMEKSALPREVWVATVTLDGLMGGSCEEVIASAVQKLDTHAAAFRPDIVCLPEAFHTAGLETGRPEDLAEVAEGPEGGLTRPLAEWAARHKCYIVCPVYTREGDRIYNSAVFYNRSGERMGEYRKIHTTLSEMEAGVSPGPMDPPVFEADFGRIGAQICFDIHWRDGWQRMEEKGVEMVFWPSAYAGGAMIESMAWLHRCCVVSSTRKDASRICDLGGRVLAASSRWNRWGACAPINLEKAILHLWPYALRYSEIEAKYGRKVRLSHYPEEELTILESRSPEVKVADVMKEFELLSYREHVAVATRRQDEMRAV